MLVQPERGGKGVKPPEMRRLPRCRYGMLALRRRKKLYPTYLFGWEFTYRKLLEKYPEPATVEDEYREEENGYRKGKFTPIWQYLCMWNNTQVDPFQPPSSDSLWCRHENLIP